MAKQGIGTGTIPNDGTGDSLLDGAIKINKNFTEIYNLLGDGTTLSVGVVTAITAGTNISISTSFGNVVISSSGLGTSKLEGTSLNVTGVSTLGNTVIGGGTTELLVRGDARITGILTIGTSSITFDGTTNSVNVGSGITIDGSSNSINIGGGITLDGTTGMISAPEIDINGQVLTGAGVTEIIAGSGISIDQGTGQVTISATGAPGPVTGDVVADSLVVSGVSTFSSDVKFGIGSTAIRYDSSVSALVFPDGKQARFGTFDGSGGDLRIFHDTDGSNSYIQDTGSGNLRIITNGTAIELAKDLSEPMATLNVDGSVDLYYNSVKKFETTAGGVTVTGILTATSFVGDGSGLTNVSVTGINTTGTSALNHLNVANVDSTGIVTATSFRGDGSQLTGIPHPTSELSIEDSGSVVGTAGTINFATNLNVTVPFAGIVTVSAVDTGDVSNWTRTTAGIHTFASVGIGTTDPIAELNVEGNTEISGALVSDLVISTPNPINRGSGSLTGIGTYTIPTAQVSNIYDIGVNKSDPRYIVTLQSNSAQVSGRELQLLTINYNGSISFSNTHVVGAGASHFEINRRGDLAYVSCPSVSKIYTYTVDFAAASITNNTVVDTATSSPRQLVVHPNNNFVYCVCNSSVVDVYQASASGPLTHIQTISAQSGADYIEIDPSGRFLYVSNYTSNTISCFTVNYKTGELTLIEHQSINDTKPTDIITDTSGSYLFVSCEQNLSNLPRVNIYQIDQSTGSLEFRHFYQVSSNTEPVLSLQVDRVTGRFIYFGTRNNVHVREINPYNGKMTFVQDIAHQDNSDRLKVDATGNYLFTSDSSAKTVTTYAISNVSYGTALANSVGIGTDFLGDRTSKLAVYNGDITIGSNSTGLILTAPNGSRHRITVDNSGTITSSPV